MSQITHKNHYVPQFYLRNWSHDGGKRLWTYRTLVSHQNVPLWKSSAIENVASFSNLYTTLSNKDEFEKWIKKEFEDPVVVALKKVLQDKKLDNSDWERLVLFFASQDKRTPTSYLEMRLSHEASFREVLQKIAINPQKHFSLVENKQTPSNYLKNSLEIEINTVTDRDGTDTDEIEINVSSIYDRDTWLEHLKNLLTNPKLTRRILKHKWSIATSFSGMFWFTSDHPAIRLNYYGNGNYDLKGGWDNKGGNLFIPLSPRHLLFTQIGMDLPDTLNFSAKQTLEFQSIIAQGASRQIFAHQKLDVVERLRPRDVDQGLFNFEENQIRDILNNRVEKRKKAK